jgi:hypothetical protein
MKPRSHISCYRECRRVWGNEPTHSQLGLPLWELRSRWTLKFSKSDFKGQNSLDWKVIYTIENLLRRRCLQWACMTHLGTWNINYGQKKGLDSSCQFDSQPLKVKNRPDLLLCRSHATYRWKVLDEGYNFASDLTSIEGLQKELWASKVAGIPILGILGLPTWESRDKMTFGCKPCGQAHRIL